MEETRHYEIILKQGDLEIELSSDDVYFISKQMDKWFKILLDDSYVPIAIAPSKPVSSSVAADTTPPPVALPEPQPAPQAVEPPPPPVVEEPPATPAVPPPVVDLPQMVAPAAQPAPEPAPPPPPPIAETPPPPPPPVEMPEAVKDDFEAVLDNLMEDLGAPVPPSAASSTPPEISPSVAPPVLQSPEPTAPAESLLEDLDDEEPHGEPDDASGSEPDLGMIDSLSDLCEKASAESPIDYLLLSAYYLNFFEAEAKFSLKRVNSLLVKTGLTPVNHAVIENAISRNHLAMVPDVTGMADVTEYSMTPDGQAAAEGLLKH